MKRARLETMLENLTLQGNAETSRKPHFQVNPLIEPLEPEPKKRRTADLDTLILEKMAEAYKDHMLQGLAVVRYAHPVSVLVWHFQQWVKRLFNMFVRKYNQRPGLRNMRPFRDFGRIMALTRDANVAFTYRDLLGIVLEENAIETQRLLRKREDRLGCQRLQEIKDEEELARESSYTYWDRVSALSGDVSALSGDVNMDEYGSDGYGLEAWPPGGSLGAGADLDMAMAIDASGAECAMLANHGSPGASYAGALC
ncbi:hypothetical protein METBIDRAFT_45413 [Metschnikowia bicuspidata var. bicuspidata NRRL YB-4993]|uniref:Uncharacterized protein n=1 Tax=Metschnikowia bicuspidata var. bicuspidata NRRL YB-4993 TaxID=869754 RepID=A0A1A0H7U4_9ASCO|nr:hypothetical protein METBIDRAFT_45413 [Metschnikowia bicuspidata var. bicuspidata NRRL YB-4993]OBA20169.1 hypothetical protein METBIDRAFT_45413 [Metschnikowia bicuspidata var. bicuspidata NRRL YB-4993]